MRPEPIINLSGWRWGDIPTEAMLQPRRYFGDDHRGYSATLAICPAYEDLERFVARVSVHRREQQEPISFALLGNAHPHVTLPALLALIDRKKKKTYVGRPLWLAIHASAGIDSALHRLREMDISTGHFQRILIFDGQDVLSFEQC